jgi:hypothetical protein
MFQHIVAIMPKTKGNQIDFKRRKHIDSANIKSSLVSLRDLAFKHHR